MKWDINKAEGFVRNFGQAMLLLTGYGLLVSFVQNVLVFFAMPLFNFFQTSSGESQSGLLADFSAFFQWVFIGFFAFLLIGFVVAFFFRKRKKWAWYGMNLVIGIAILVVILGTAFFYELIKGLNVAVIENISAIKVLVSLLSFALILLGLAMFRGLNRAAVRKLFASQ